jgi:arginyl-tRNA synthetase
LADVVNEVGKDVVRFTMLTRKADAQMDFDFAKVVEARRTIRSSTCNMPCPYFASHRDARRRGRHRYTDRDLSLLDTRSWSW